MNRRDTIKSLLAGSLSGGFLFSACTSSEEPQTEALASVAAFAEYGRTKEEQERDAKIAAENFLNSHELETIAHLVDIILPKTETLPSAIDLGVVKFIDFIVKDMTYYQLPIRGGVMWMDSYMLKAHDKAFVDCDIQQQLALCDKIAFPGKTEPDLLPGEEFFTHIRNLVLTGYYTTREGIEELGYTGNTPNVWEGVPQEILEAHGMSYEQEWLSKCVDQSKRDIQAEWDDQGNLLT